MPTFKFTEGSSAVLRCVITVMPTTSAFMGIQGDDAKGDKATANLRAKIEAMGADHELNLSDLEAALLDFTITDCIAICEQHILRINAVIAHMTDGQDQALKRVLSQVNGIARVRHVLQQALSDLSDAFEESRFSDIALREVDDLLDERP